MQLSQSIKHKITFKYAGIFDGRQDIYDEDDSPNFYAYAHINTKRENMLKKFK